MMLASGPAVGQSSASQSVFGADPNLSDGALALRLGDFEEGIRLTLEGLRSPAGTAHSIRTRSSAHNNLCAGYVMGGKFQEALEHCNEALRLKPNNWHAYSNRAVLLYPDREPEQGGRGHRTRQAHQPRCKAAKGSGGIPQCAQAARDRTVRQT